MPEQTLNINTPGGVKTTSGYTPSEGEVFKLDDYTVGRIQGGQLQQIDPQMYYMDKYGVNVGNDLEGARKLGISGLGSEALFSKFAEDIGFDINNINKADRGFLADAGYLRSPKYVSGTDFDFSKYIQPGQDLSGFTEQGMRDYTDAEKNQIFSGSTPNFKPQGEGSQTQIYGNALNVNGQTISPSDPNYDTYAKQLGAIGTPNVPLDGQMPETFGRYLGPTEFNNLRKEWTKAFNDAGIRDINVINDAIENEFLKRNKRDIYLNTGARDISEVIEDTKIQNQAQNSFNQIAGGSTSNIVNANDIRVDLPKTSPIIEAKPDQLSTLANNIVDSTLKGIYDYSEEQRKKVETNRLQAENEKNQLKDAVAGMANENYLERRTKEILAEYKIKDTNDKLTSVGEEMARIQEALGLRLAQEGERVGPLGFMTREKQQLLEQGNARLSALASIAEVYRGNIDIAMDLANTTLSAINADRENKINSYNNLLELANNDILNLKAEEKDYADRQISILTDQIEESRRNKDFVMELILSNPLAAQNGGLTLLDSPEQAVSKIKPILAQQELDAQMRELANEGSNRLLTLEEAAKYGVPVGTRISDLSGTVPTELNGGKPPTQNQYQAAAFLMRMQQSEDILNSLEPNISSMGTAEFLYQKTLPYVAKSDAMKQLDQAQRNFINAILRRESGAAISESEFTSAERQYFPQPGDTQQVLEQKQQSRMLAMQGLRNEAGPAYTDPTPDFSNVSLPPLTQSYSTLDDLVRDHAEYQSVIDQIARDSLSRGKKLDDNDILQILSSGGFKSDLSTSVKGSDLSSFTNGKASLSIGSGTITGIDGSKYWSQGLDFVLDGGKGAFVPSPFSGKVIAARENGGFGKQVKLKLTSGEEIWLSHLDKINVKEGDYIQPGQFVGTQGNTGKTYSTSGGDGTHIDITMKKPDGNYYTSREVAAILSNKTS